MPEKFGSSLSTIQKPSGEGAINPQIAQKLATTYHSKYFQEASHLFSEISHDFQGFSHNLQGFRHCCGIETLFQVVWPLNIKTFGGTRPLLDSNHPMYVSVCPVEMSRLSHGRSLQSTLIYTALPKHTDHHIPLRGFSLSIFTSPLGITLQAPQVPKMITRTFLLVENFVSKLRMASVTQVFLAGIMLCNWAPP